MKTNYFIIFQQECWHWINKMELNNWTYRFSEKSKKEMGIFEAASIRRDGYNCQADIHFDKSYKFKDVDDVKKAAKHEVLHCLIGKLYLLGKDRNFNVSEYEREEEELIHKLEKLVN